MAKPFVRHNADSKSPQASVAEADIPGRRFPTKSKPPVHWQGLDCGYGTVRT
jgi:hypothetical protein